MFINGIMFWTDIVLLVLFIKERHKCNRQKTINTTNIKNEYHSVKKATGVNKNIQSNGVSVAKSA